MTTRHSERLLYSQSELLLPKGVRWSKPLQANSVCKVPGSCLISFFNAVRSFPLKEFQVFNLKKCHLLQNYLRKKSRVSISANANSLVSGFSSGQSCTESILDSVIVLQIQWTWSKKVGKGQHWNVLLPLIFSGHIHYNSGFDEVFQVLTLSWFRKEKKTFLIFWNFSQDWETEFPT